MSGITFPLFYPIAGIGIQQKNRIKKKKHKFANEYILQSILFCLSKIHGSPMILISYDAKLLYMSLTSFSLKWL